ncbi:MAG: LysE family transporter [Dehalococcoidales bacterium]|nr:LysE family transporter [Dehalococcoidales bacterium]
MLPFLLSVVVISLSVGMMPGPLSAVTIAKSYKSQFAGAQIALGHAIVEIPLMLLIYFGFARFFQEEMGQLILYLVGGVVLIWLGIGMFKAKARVIGMGKDLPYHSVVAGVVTSAFNPFFILWWATIGSMLIMTSLNFGTTGFALFIPVHWLCDLVWLSFISILIFRTRSLWGRKFQEGLFITCSLLLIGFGGWFLISGLKMMVW